LLGKVWLAALGKRKDNFNPTGAKLYLVAAGGAFVNAAALAWLIQAIPTCETVSHATALGTFVGVGVVLATGPCTTPSPAGRAGSRPSTSASTSSASPRWGDHRGAAL